MANLGCIGLGVIGSRMVDRPMAKGHTDEAWFDFKMMQKDCRWPSNSGAV